MAVTIDLSGRVALVTGAGTGIGNGTASVLAAAGAHVVVADLDPSAAGATVDAIVEAGGAAEALTVDVRDADAVRTMAEAVIGMHGHLDVLVQQRGSLHRRDAVREERLRALGRAPCDQLCACAQLHRASSCPGCSPQRERVDHQRVVGRRHPWVSARPRVRPRTKRQSSTSHGVSRSTWPGAVSASTPSRPTSPRHHRSTIGTGSPKTCGSGGRCGSPRARRRARGQRRRGALPRLRPLSVGDWSRHPDRRWHPRGRRLVPHVSRRALDQPPREASAARPRSLRPSRRVATRRISSRSRRTWGTHTRGCTTRRRCTTTCGWRSVRGRAHVDHRHRTSGAGAVVATPDGERGRDRDARGPRPGRVAVAIGAGFTGRHVLGQRPMRWADVREYIVVLRALLRGEDAEWEGATIRMIHPDGFGAPRPISVPILVGADGPRGTAVAAEVADGTFAAGRPNRDATGGWTGLLQFGTVLDDGELLDSARVLEAAGPGLAGRVRASRWRGPRPSTACPVGRCGARPWNRCPSRVVTWRCTRGTSSCSRTGTAPRSRPAERARFPTSRSPAPPLTCGLASTASSSRGSPSSRITLPVPTSA